MSTARWALFVLILCFLQACSASDAEKASVDPGMTIEPDTSVEGEIRQQAPPDSLDPEMTYPSS